MKCAEFLWRSWFVCVSKPNRIIWSLNNEELAGHRHGDPDCGFVLLSGLNVYSREQPRRRRLVTLQVQFRMHLAEPWRDAQVTLTNQETDAKLTQTTGSDGLYQFSNLLPGRYRIDVGDARLQAHDPTRHSGAGAADFQHKSDYAGRRRFPDSGSNQ